MGNPTKATPHAGQNHRSPPGPGIVLFQIIVLCLLAFYERVVACAARMGSVV
jgi:hypothetical protein